MHYVGTRDPSPKHSLSSAIRQSLASDGGLFVPEAYPRFGIDDFADLDRLPAIAARWLEPFFSGDELAPELRAICEATFRFPIPLIPLDAHTSVLELFHGPTLAFKDVGARFLAECLSRLSDGGGRARTILVATSGDTGGAVAAAFHNRPGFEVVILFPKGRVSPRQEKQLTCWGGNVRACAVTGDFDDCQRLVKSAFSDLQGRIPRSLVSANSINLGRLLPQGAYYVAACLQQWRRNGRAAGIVVPTGNLGNAVAALWAKRTGLPIAKVVLATNANRAIVEYFKTGRWEPLATVPTPANAMDVGNPSNMERLRHLYPKLEDLRKEVIACSFDAAKIREGVETAKRRWNRSFCPHTAIAVAALQALPPGDWILAATAHAAKFAEVVEPWLGETVAVPPALQALLTKPSHAIEIAPTLEALRAALES